MKPEWRDFLDNKGAEFEHDKVVSFGNTERELRVVTTGKILADLSHKGLVSARGDDAVAFLQGQFTNDIRQVSDTHSQLSAYCSPKGRMLANFRIFKRGDTYFLRMPRELVEPTLKRLRMFVLMSKVVLEDAADQLVCFGYSGPGADAELADYLGAAPPETPDGALQKDELTIVRVAGPQPRFEVYGDLAAAQKLWGTLEVRAAPVGDGPWALLDILSGIPVVYPETADAFVPQMANMQQINGVSFKKGCYTGQEVVARMQYLGRLKRRMYLAQVDTDHCPGPGEPLYAAGSSSGQGTGKIVNAQPCPEGGCKVLAIVEIASREGDEIRLGTADGPPLHFLDLPYSVETDEPKPSSQE